MTFKLTHVAVLIPARNEQDLISACLHSVHRALAALPPDISSDIVIAVDRSTDLTLTIAARDLRGAGVTIPSHAGAVGEARALAAKTALKRYAGPPEHCWLANTDADSVVPEHWLTAQLALAAEGYDAVAGTVDVVDFSDHLPTVEQRFRSTYPIAPDGSHPHVHGANLGLRASAYLAAGGWSCHATGEDHDLWKRLSRLNIRKISVNRTRVITSGRRVGRAPQGFAAALAAHNA